MLLEKPDIVEIARVEGLEIQQAGSRYKTACPFHSEKTASMFFFPDNRFYCFGCGERGDAVDLVRKLHGLGFVAACQYLNIKQGRVDPQVKKQIEERRRQREREKKYRQYIAAVSAVLCDRVVTYGRVLKRLNRHRFELIGHYFHQVQIWDHWIDILVDPLSDPDDVKQVIIAFRNQESHDVKEPRRFYRQNLEVCTG